MGDLEEESAEPPEFEETTEYEEASPDTTEVCPAPAAPPGNIEEQLQELDDKQWKAFKKRHRSFWKKPPTFVYADNFGFGVNSYQPMIDYLDVKDSGGYVNKDDIHLPLLEERCLRQYEARKPFKWYENRDIDTYIDKGEKIRTQIRQNDAVGIGNVLRRTHTNWSMARKWVQLVKNSYVVDYRKQHKKGAEFEDTTSNYHRPAPTPLIKAATVDYRSLAPKPTHYLDQMSSEVASVVKALARSRMDHESVMASRREKLALLDNQFEDAVGHIYQQMRRITERANMYNASAKDPREIEINEQDLALRNRIRRAEELQNMIDCVNDLTEMDSARNTLRTSLRNLDDELLGLSSRIDDMKHQQVREVTRDINEMDRNADLDIMKAVVDARRSASRARSLPPEEEDVMDELANFRKPRHADLFPVRERVTPRPRETLMPTEMISDVYARVLHKAGELSSAGEISARTSEQRRINSRARFINVMKPRPDTADEELLVPPSRTEMNIDYMSKTLAARGLCQRRFQIEQEVDQPHSHLMTNAYKDYCELRIRKPVEVHPSLSNRVRYAHIRARARNSLMGY